MRIFKKDCDQTRVVNGKKICTYKDGNAEITVTTDENDNLLSVKALNLAKRDFYVEGMNAGIVDLSKATPVKEEMRGYVKYTEMKVGDDTVKLWEENGKAFEAEVEDGELVTLFNEKTRNCMKQIDTNIDTITFICDS